MSWQFWKSRAPRSAEAEKYVATTRRRIPPKLPFEEIAFVILDAETTGFDVTQDRLLSIATLPIHNGAIAMSGMKTWMVFHPSAPLNEATTVHGILPSETAEGSPESEVVAELLPGLTRAVIVGHHIGFDIAMLNQALKRHQRINLVNPIIDTAAMAMKTLDAFGQTAYPGQRPPSLEETCEHCGIQPMERHTAAGDAFTTAELFLVMCARLRRLKGRPLTAGDLPLERG